MANIPLIIVITVIYGLLIANYSIQDKNYAAVSLLGCILAVLITVIFYPLNMNIIIGYINFQAIIILISLSIIVRIARESKILEWIAFKLFNISKGNVRHFFYFICVITTLLSSIISGIVVILVLAPIVIRLCYYIKIPSGTFLLGMTLCINIGSLLFPWKNIIISTHFNLDPLFYFKYIWGYAFLSLFLTIFLIDFLWLSKEPDVEAEQKKIVLELIDTEVIIENKKVFYFNSISILVIFSLFIILPSLYLTAAVSALLLILFNKKRENVAVSLKNIEWDFIFFFAISYIMVGLLSEAGLKDLIQLLPLHVFPVNFLILVLTLLVLIVISFLPDTPTALIFIPFVEVLILNNGTYFLPIMISFLVTFNLGGNFLPQGSSCDMLTLQLANDHQVINLNFKRLLKVGALITTLHLLILILFTNFLVYLL